MCASAIFFNVNYGILQLKRQQDPLYCFRWSQITDVASQP